LPRVLILIASNLELLEVCHSSDGLLGAFVGVYGFVKLLSFSKRVFFLRFFTILILLLRLLLIVRVVSCENEIVVKDSLSFIFLLLSLELLLLLLTDVLPPPFNWIEIFVGSRYLWAIELFVEDVSFPLVRLCDEVVYNVRSIERRDLPQLQKALPDGFIEPVELLLQLLLLGLHLREVLVLVLELKLVLLSLRELSHLLLLARPLDEEAELSLVDFGL